MKKLLIALSLCSHPLIYSVGPFIVSGKRGKPAPRPAIDLRELQEQDVTPEHFEKTLHSPVTKYETDDRILFFGPLKPDYPYHLSIKALFNKETGRIEISQLYSRGVESGILRSPYDQFPAATFNALQALYEKQQEERKQNS